ncbi:Increased DNA methylation 1 [Dichanthelium oligosanthes]|uniref:Increased DNA methylation 1 n=1 Tax=Dichanthelium oligosanthes TaxID=888268 RepID=A0A1E5VKD2_9POAL|nr:Increased DNA methylation 1 [Dichanthelium oligosanthes]
MDGKDLFVEIGMKEEDIATMLFGKKIAEMAEDAFDGSKEERQIFEGVFCIASIDGLTDNHHEGTGHIADAGKALTGSSIPSSSASIYKTAHCRIVESFTAGNLSSYRAFCRAADQQTHRAMPSPHAGTSELVVQWTPPLPDRVYTRRAVTRRSERARICSAMDLENIGICKFGRQRDGRGYGELWNHLRLHAHLLMVDAGWKIEGKKRDNKSKVDHVYVAPDKVTRLFSLPRAWKCFGQWLLLTTPCIDGNESNDYGKEWLNMHDFLYDLKNTLLCLQYEVQRPKQSLSFLHQWRLLDPFMAVVCIDKKIAALKNGTALKGMNSTVTFLSCSERKLLNAKNESRSLGVNYTSNYNNIYLSSSKKSLLPLFLSETDGQPDNEGNSLPNEQPSTFHTNNPSEFEAHQQSLWVSEINERSIRSTAHRIVTGLHDATAVLGSRQNCLSKKKQFPCIKSKLEQQVEDKSDPLYFPPSYSSALGHPDESVQIEDLNSHGYETTEIPYVGNSAGTPDEMLLGENLLFSPEVDEMLLGITDDINNEQHDAAVVSEPQFADKDARDGPSGTSSLPPEKDAYMGAKEDSIDNGHNGPAVLSQFQMEDKDARDKSSGALSLQSEKDRDLGVNEISLEDPTKTEQLSSDTSGKALMVSEPEVLFVSPQDGTLSFMNNNINNQEMLSYLNDTMGTQASVYEASLIQGFLYLDSQGSPICWTVTNPEPPRQSICAADLESSSRLSKHYGEMNLENEASAYEHKEILESGSSKKGQKRPDKLADIQGNVNTKKQKVKDAPLRNCWSQYMDDVTDNPAGPVFLNEEEQIVTTIIKQVPSNLEPKNKDDKDQDEQSSEHSKQLMSKEALKKDNKRQKKTWSRTCKFDDDDLLMTAVIHKLTARYRNCFHRRLTNKLGFRRLPRYRWEREEGGFRKKFPGGARTVLNKLLEMGIVARVNILQYRGPGGKNVLKDGNITSNGIRCRCCGTTFTMSKFKCHACLTQEIPSLNLFLGTGKSYSLCQLQAWSIEQKVRKERAKDTMSLQGDQNDDICGSCGDGGELICCDSCPASYHQSCLPCQDIPDGNWYCSICLCDICGEVINSKELRTSFPALECLQCERQCNVTYHTPPFHCHLKSLVYHAKCIAGKVLHNEKGGPDSFLCGRRCQQIYTSFHCRVGVPDHMDDGFSCTVLHNNGDQKVRTAADIALMAECNMKLMIGLSIMEECFLPILDPRTGIDIIPSILYNWRSDFVHLDHKGFYTVVLENDDNIISVASIRLHGAIVAEMPLIATCTENRQQGMCRRLMDYIEEMLKSLKVEMLLLSAIPLLVDIWTSAFGFKEIDDSDKKKLSKVRLATVPGTVLLKKSLCERAGITDAGEPPNPKPLKVYSRVPRNRTGLNVLMSQ